jgi:predicted N-acetyltransferase YhbS
VPILELNNAQDVETARKDFIAQLNASKTVDKGEQQQAKDFANGANLAFMSKMKKHRFLICKDDAQHTIGLIRLEVGGGEVKIANLAGVPARGAGKALVTAAIEFARGNGHQKIKLNANDAKLIPYYEKFGFKADQPGGLNMTRAV